MMIDDLSQFRQTYITECFELLAEMEERLLQLEPDQADKEELNAIFRCAHSIKGGAGVFGLHQIAAFTHILETLLDKVRDGIIAPQPDVVELLLKARDVVHHMVSCAHGGTEPDTSIGADIAAALESYIATHGDQPAPAVSIPDVTATPPSCDANLPSDKPMRTFHIRFVPGATLLAHGSEPILLLRELAALGEAEITCDYSHIPTLDKFDADLCYLRWEITLHTKEDEAAIREVFEFVEDECVLEITPLIEERAAAAISPAFLPSASAVPSTILTPTAPIPLPSSNTATASAASPAATSIRVDIHKVDALINMVGEVVITQAMLAAQSQMLPAQQCSALISGIEELSQHTRELQEAVMAIRMQPVKSIFARMPRLVHDLAAKLGKEVSLIMQGENTEVDKTIIEQLSDPLTHLIRNAVDHGIESPDTRLEHGKPRQGNIWLLAEHRSGRIVIEIKDNGHGINRDKVLAKAVEKGLVSPQAQLSQSDIDNLIFAPGFSTASAVSDVSGRGVGMDVVKRNIEGLGGSVHVESTLDSGSTFTITLPLTLAILDGMIVRVGHERYIIPIVHIIESMRPKSEEIRTVAGGGSVIRVRGEFIPLLYLHRVFGVHSDPVEAHKGLVVLVENGGSQIGLVIDELIGQQQLVIKSLEDNADPVAGISGATILGDGNVSLILDIVGLCRMGYSAAKSAASSQFLHEQNAA